MRGQSGSRTVIWHGKDDNCQTRSRGPIPSHRIASVRYRHLSWRAISLAVSLAVHSCPSWLPNQEPPASTSAYAYIIDTHEHTHMLCAYIHTYIRGNGSCYLDSSIASQTWPPNVTSSRQLPPNTHLLVQNNAIPAARHPSATNRSLSGGETRPLAAGAKCEAAHRFSG